MQARGGERLGTGVLSDGIFHYLVRLNYAADVDFDSLIGKFKVDGLCFPASPRVTMGRRPNDRGLMTPDP
eukprot:3706562-Pyramimonas_sp.AAC.1